MKKHLGGINLLYPTPTVLVGAMVDGKANFTTVAHVGILNRADPNIISMGLGKGRHTTRGIKEHGAFSVNIPSEDLVVETDYCGIVSGTRTDKSRIFDLFTGELEGVPMIRQCPIAMECRLRDIYELPTHEVIIGEIVASYAEESAMTDGKVDITKVKPLLFDMSSMKYWSVGREVARCSSIGKKLKAPK